MQKQTWINVYLATDIGLILVILVVLPLHQTGAKLFSVVFFFYFIHQSAVLYPSIPLSIHYDHLVAAWRSNGPAWLLVMYSLYSQHPHLCVDVGVGSLRVGILMQVSLLRSLCSYPQNTSVLFRDHVNANLPQPPRGSSCFSVRVKSAVPYIQV